MLASVTFGVQDNGSIQQPMTYSYAYSNAGRINTQTISWTLPDSVNTSATVQYQWDNQGKMTSLIYPGGQQFNY